MHSDLKILQKYKTKIYFFNKICSKFFTFSAIVLLLLSTISRSQDLYKKNRIRFIPHCNDVIIYCNHL